MKKIRSNRFLNRSAKAIAVLFLLACAGGPADWNEFTSYFMPESTTTQAGDKRYHFTQQFLYLDEYNDSLRLDKVLNAKAWADYAGVSEAIAYNYFYSESANNTLPNRLMLKGNKAAVAYLKLAKSVERAYRPAIYSWEEGSKDSLVLVEAFGKATSLAKSTTDSFLKERYGFQAVKLAMMNYQPDDCLEAYETLIAPLKFKTFISDWAFARKAGATLSIGDTAKAIYEFAQVFNRCPSRRREADLSLRIKGIRFQEAALSFCKNEVEKAAIYAICAIQPLEDGLPMLKKMVELNPKNQLIELITAREINRNEYYSLGEIPFVEDTVAFEKRRDESKSYFEQLANFTASNAENKALNNPAFWFTAASYMAYVTKDYDKASDLLTKAQANPTTNAALQQQIKVQEMLLLIAKQKEITPEFETQAIGRLEELKKSDNFRVVNAYTRACGLLAKMYRGQPMEEQKSGGFLSGCSRKTTEVPIMNLAKAFLLEGAASWQSSLPNSDGYSLSFASNTDRYAVEDSATIETVQDVLKYLQTSSKSDFDKRLAKLSGFDNDYLHIVLGRKQLNIHQYAEAAQSFEQVAPATWKAEPFATYLDSNPFYLKPNNGQKPNELFTPVTFAKKMAELQTKMTTGDAQAAYLLGCGAFNMGYFGNSWLLSNRYRSSAEYEYMYPPRNLSDEDYYVAKQAKTYFEKALQLAKEPELAAKAAFGASLCEQNAFAIFRAAEGRDIGYEEKEQTAFTSRIKTEARQRLGKYFGLLQKKYADAQYTREVIRECATYREFTGE